MAIQINSELRKPATRAQLAQREADRLGQQTVTQDQHLVRLRAVGHGVWFIPWRGAV